MAERWDAVAHAEVEKDNTSPDEKGARNRKIKRTLK